MWARALQKDTRERARPLMKLHIVYIFIFTHNIYSILYTNIMNNSYKIAENWKFSYNIMDLTWYGDAVCCCVDALSLFHLCLFDSANIILCFFFPYIERTRMKIIHVRNFNQYYLLISGLFIRQWLFYILENKMKISCIHSTILL